MGLGTGATAAIVGGIGAAGSIASGAIGAHAAGKAADAQTQAANHAADLQAQQAQQALAFQKQVYGDQQTNQRPFLQAGQGATYSLANLLGIRMPQQGSAPTTLPSGNILNGSSVDPSGFANLTALRGGNGGNFFNPKSLTSQPEGMFPGGAPPDPNDLGATGRFGMMPPNAFGAGVPLPTGSTSSFNTAAPITSPGTGGNQFQMRPPITSPGTGTQGQINPPITSPGAGGPYQIQMRPPILSGGAAGMLNPDGSTGADFTPGQQTLGLNQNPSPNVTNATTNQGGTGQVPQGGVTGPDGTVGLGDPSPFGSGGIGNLTGGPGSADDNSFGSLLKGYGQQFVAPTDVTEQNDPGYKFRLQQGNDAIQRSAAARGGLLSGGTAKALTDYAQGSASQEYGNVYNRALSTFDNNYNQFNNDQTNKFNRLASLAGFGQTAAGQLSNAGSNAANNVSSTLLTSGQQIGNDYQNAGAARASGYVGGANAVNGAIGGIGGSLTNALLLSQYLGGRGAGAGGNGV